MRLIVEGGTDVIDPDPVAVEVAIRAMDGVSRTQVALFESEGQALTVGGGGEAFVIAMQKGATIRVALGRRRPEGEDDWVQICNGQLTDYPKSEIVSVDEAVQAAAAFLEDRREASELAWDDMV